VGHLGCAACNYSGGRKDIGDRNVKATDEQKTEGGKGERKEN